MRTHTPRMMRRYVAASRLFVLTGHSDALGWIIVRTDALAQHSDDSADALPSIIRDCAVRQYRHGDSDRDGWERIIRKALLSAERNRTRTRGALDIDGLADTLPSDTPDTPAPRWEDVRDSLPSDNRKALDSIAADGVNRYGVAALADMSRRPFRATVAGQALGIGKADKAGRWTLTPAQRRAVRSTGAVGWALASVAMGTARQGETVAQRAQRAGKYIDPARDKRDAAFQRDRALMSAATGSHPVREADSAALATAQPSLSHTAPLTRKGPSTRSRKGVVYPSTSRRYAAMSETFGIESGRLSVTVAGVADALASDSAGPIRSGNRASDAAERASAIHAERWADVRRRCTRPILSGPALGEDYAAPVAQCGCGGATGVELEAVHPVRQRSDETEQALAPYWVHPLTVCPAPVAGRGGVVRCGCGRKRGALIPTGAADIYGHAPR